MMLISANGLQRVALLHGSGRLHIVGKPCDDPSIRRGHQLCVTVNELSYRLLAFS